jgi:hypothetical protein
MSKKTTTKTAKRPRLAGHHSSIHLSELDRAVLTMYHTAPAHVRAAVGQQMFHAWTHPSDSGANEKRFQAAKTRFNFGTCDLSVLDDLLAGEELKRGAR